MLLGVAVALGIISVEESHERLENNLKLETAGVEAMAPAFKMRQYAHGFPRGVPDVEPSKQ